MKNGLMVGCVLLVVMNVACKKKPDKPENSNTSVTLDDVKKEIGEAANKGAELLKQQRDKFAASMNDELGTLDRRIAELEKQANEASAELKDEWTAHVASLKSKRDDARKKLTELREKSPDAWEAMKD